VNSKITGAVQEDCYDIFQASATSMVEEIAFEDTLKLIPKSWWALDAEANALAECRSMLEALSTVCVLGPVDLFRMEILSETDFTQNPLTGNQYSKHQISSNGYDTLVKMGCWEVVDIPPDVQFLGVRWVFKLKHIQSVYEKVKARLVVKGTCRKKTFITVNLIRLLSTKCLCESSWF
jgi:hypothetical protein